MTTTATPAAPTREDVLATFALDVALTVMDVLDRLPNADWSHRGTVRNRLWDLTTEGVLITDEGRPVRFALNHLA